MLAFFALWVATIIEVSISRFKSKNDKWIWLLVVILAGLIGCIFYYVMGRKNRIRDDAEEAGNGSER